MTASTFDRIATSEKRNLVRDWIVGVALALGVAGGAMTLETSAKSLAVASMTQAAATQTQVAQSEETECFIAFGNEAC